MIDIISTSIKIGKYLRNSTNYKEFFDKYHDIKENASNQQDPKQEFVSGAHFQSLEKEMLTKGFAAFNYLEMLVAANYQALSAQKLITDDVKVNLIKEWYEFIQKQEIKALSIQALELEDIINKFIVNIFSNIDIDIETIGRIPFSLKLSHLYNVLRTAILRSGVFSTINTIKELRTNLNIEFLNKIEIERQQCDYYPFNKQFKNLIAKYGSTSIEYKILMVTENMRLVEFIIKEAIVQGFFHDIYKIDSERIIKIRIFKKQNKIFPIALKMKDYIHFSHLFHLMSVQNLNGYILSMKSSFVFNKQESTTTIVGYFYPANEYKLFDS